MIFPVIELVDRYSIAKLKNQKTQGANLVEFEFYHRQLENYLSNINTINSELEQLYKIHEQIWELESQLKSGKESELALEEIGRRAICIRDLNNQRIKLKNIMAEKLGCAVKEIKKDHLSQ
jgi:hypothetical protein